VWVTSLSRTCAIDRQVAPFVFMACSDAWRRTLHPLRWAKEGRDSSDEKSRPSVASLKYEPRKYITASWLLKGCGIRFGTRIWYQTQGPARTQSRDCGRTAIKKGPAPKEPAREGVCALSRGSLSDLQCSSDASLSLRWLLGRGRWLRFWRWRRRDPQSQEEADAVPGCSGRLHPIPSDHKRASFSCRHLWICSALVFHGGSRS
jgi:hypothetical protein